MAKHFGQLYVHFYDWSIWNILVLGSVPARSFSQGGLPALFQVTPCALFMTPGVFLTHLAFRPCELLSSLFVCRRPSTFHILIFSSETTGPIATKLWWNDPWMAPFQKCVRWSRLPTKMAAKLKIEKRGDQILIVHCCFSASQNELKF
jgi:hypothetical protein